MGIAVVTVESLEGETKEMYAEKLFRQPPGIGKKDKDNGLLILVAKEEREYRFEVGYGLEGTITDSMKVNIGDRIIVPNFQNSEYGKGIYESMVVIQGLLKGNQEVISQYSMPQTDNQELPGWVFLCHCSISYLFYCRLRKRYRRLDLRRRVLWRGGITVKGRIIYYFGDNTSTSEDHTPELPIKVRAKSPIGN